MVCSWNISFHECTINIVQKTNSGKMNVTLFYNSTLQRTVLENFFYKSFNQIKATALFVGLILQRTKISIPKIEFELWIHSYIFAAAIISQMLIRKLFHSHNHVGPHILTIFCAMFNLISFVIMVLCKVCFLHIWCW